MTTTLPNNALGSIVSWTPPHSVAFSRMRDALKTAGLSEDLARELLPRNAFSRAARELSEERVIRKLKETDDGKIHFQFTREERIGKWDHDDLFEYSLEDVVILDKESGFVVTKDGNAQLASHVHDLIESHLATRNATDVTRAVKQVYEEAGGDLVTLRDGGGVYFVPEKHASLVEQTRVFLRECGGTIREFKIQAGDGHTEVSVAESMLDHLTGLILEFRDSCERVTTDSSDGMVARRHERVAELRSKLEQYRGLLGAAAERIGASIAEAERDLIGRLAGPIHAAVAE